MTIRRGILNLGPVAGLCAGLAGGLPATAQGTNPWSPQTGLAPQYAPSQPAAPTTPAGSYAPADLDARLSGVRAPAAPLPTAPTSIQGAAAPTAPVVAPITAPVAGSVAPPYAGLPLTPGYSYGYVPVAPVLPGATTVFPYSGLGTAYPYGLGSGYPGYGYGYGSGSPSYGYGAPGWGNGWNGLSGWNGLNGLNGWNGWGPMGSGWPFGGFSPFGFW